MSKRTCKDCRNRFSDEGTCPVRFGVSDTDDATNCDTFEPITVFDRITSSPEVLAEKLVFSLTPGVFTSHIIDTVHLHAKDAFAATVEKLKEVCDE